jgi:hypothetical protein
MDSVTLPRDLIVNRITDIVDPVEYHSFTIRTPFWADPAKKDCIICEFVYDDGRVVRAAVNQAGVDDTENPDYTKILETFSLDEIEKNTASIHEIAAQEHQRAEETRKALVEKQKADALFHTKLEILEQIDAVRESPDMDLKNKIRKAKTSAEAIAYASIILANAHQRPSKGFWGMLTTRFRK